jgi:hypothetical protein
MGGAFFGNPLIAGKNAEDFERAVLPETCPAVTSGEPDIVVFADPPVPP